MSGDGSHRRGGERPTLLPSHLWNSITGLPPETHGVLIGPLQLFMGNVPLATLLNIPPRYLLLERNLPLWSPVQPSLWHLGPPQGPNGDTLPQPCGVPTLIGRQGCWGIRRAIPP